MSISHQTDGYTLINALLAREETDAEIADMFDGVTVKTVSAIRKAIALTCPTLHHVLEVGEDRAVAEEVNTVAREHGLKRCLAGSPAYRLCRTIAKVRIAEAVESEQDELAEYLYRHEVHPFDPSSVYYDGPDGDEDEWYAQDEAENPEEYAPFKAAAELLNAA